MGLLPAPFDYSLSRRARKGQKARGPTAWGPAGPHGPGGPLGSFGPIGPWGILCQLAASSSVRCLFVCFFMVHHERVAGLAGVLSSHDWDTFRRDSDPGSNLAGRRLLYAFS